MEYIEGNNLMNLLKSQKKIQDKIKTGQVMYLEEGFVLNVFC